jgi:hypothetical protein
MARIVNERWPALLVTIVVASGCTHAVHLREASIDSSRISQIPFGVDVVIDGSLRAHVSHASTYAGVVKHNFDVAVGPALATALERAAQQAFRRAVVVSAPTRERPALVLALSGQPVVNVTWEQGLLLVGQRTDCILAVEARLVSDAGDQVWQTVVTAEGHHETGRLANWPTAAQAEPAVRQAIEALAHDLILRVATASEIAAYHPSEPQAAGLSAPTNLPDPERSEGRTRGGRSIATQDTHPQSVEQRLLKLDDLRRQGLITDDEYRAKRRQILQDL